jgi:ketosteroid isomerase-like protein
MSAPPGATLVSLLLAAALACSPAPQPPAGDAAGDAVADIAGIDSLNARLVRAYRDRDPQAYGALYTDSAVFEWPAFNTVRGPAGMAAMVRGNWAALNDMDLRLTVSSRRVASGQATEFGAFEQSWRDSSGARMAEFGRYVTQMVRGSDGVWRMDRFFGFADSTRKIAARP